MVNRMKQFVKGLIPFFVGLLVAALLYFTVGWWGFWVIFPWIGLAITVGNRIGAALPRQKRGVGRRIAMIMILPSLLLFVPLVNHENFQLEGIVLLLSIGCFSKGVIHYAVAKVFGPLVWGRGFCGWACWTGAVLEWLPLKEQRTVAPSLKRLRYLVLLISVLLPVYLVWALNYNVRADYLNRQEMIWMLAGNGIYYLLAIPLAYIFQDRRAFCKVACPVSLVMKIPARFSRIMRRPSGIPCIECGRCSGKCPMDIDVMAYIRQGKKVTDTECIQCGECQNACPVGAIR
jgi:ferredoxin-type protein NapH